LKLFTGFDRGDSCLECFNQENYGLWQLVPVIYRTSEEQFLYLMRLYIWSRRDRRGRDRMVVGFITTYAITKIVNLNTTKVRYTQYNIM